MKKRIIILFAWLVLFPVAIISAQERFTFGNSALGIQISSVHHWSEVDENGQESILELVNRNHNLQLSVWKVPNSRSAREYLEDWALSEGMIISGKPYFTNVDGRLATTIAAECLQLRRPYKNLLLAIPSDTALLIMHFQCPVECYREHKSEMRTLISSISLGSLNEIREFYAQKTSL